MELRELLIDQLRGSIYEVNTYFAGGCVRDWLLDGQSELKEADLCVNLVGGGISLAEMLCAKLKGNDLKVHPEFGTASFSYHGLRLEFVATRKEIYHKGSRFPQVSFGNLKDDVLRRDFTINSLLLQISTAKLIDLTGLGMADLQARLIRCIGNPKHKFREDPLRLLRALRFAVRFNFSLEPATLEAWQSEAKGIEKLSPRAIDIELNKLDSVQRQVFLQKLQELGG